MSKSKKKFETMPMEELMKLAEAGPFRVMCRTVLPAVHLVRSGAWTLDSLEKWLESVIAGDANSTARMEAIGQIISKLSEDELRLVLKQLLLRVCEEDHE